MFDKNLKRIMEEKGATVSQLSRETGFSKSAISQYMNGIIIPSKERIEIIAGIFQCSVADLTEAPKAPGPAIRPQGKNKLTCREAATLMHKRVEYVREGLQQGRPGFEFGSAVKTSSKWSYCIYANKFTEVTGIPVDGNG